jgi:hypothetical protein
VAEPYGSVPRPVLTPRKAPFWGRLAPACRPVTTCLVGSSDRAPMAPRGACITAASGGRGLPHPPVGRLGHPPPSPQAGVHPRTPCGPIGAGGGFGSLRRYGGTRSPKPPFCRLSPAMVPAQGRQVISLLLTLSACHGVGFGKGVALLHAVPALRVPSARAPWPTQGIGTGNIGSALRAGSCPCRGHRTGNRPMCSSPKEGFPCVEKYSPDWG